jgi:hypothetical protein
VARFRVLRISVLSIFAFVSGAAQAQEPGTTAPVVLVNQEVRVTNLPSLTAPAKNRPAVVVAALDTILHEPAVCCGKNSALEDVALYASLTNGLSLQELSAKLQGKHLLSDGQPIVVTAEYIPQSSIYVGFIVWTLQEQHALLIEWKSHVYVLYGAIFDETRDPYAGAEDSIHKLFLLDLRFSDQRREVIFDRETDDWGRVGGLLTVDYTIQPSPWK